MTKARNPMLSANIAEILSSQRETSTKNADACLMVRKNIIGIAVNALCGERIGSMSEKGRVTMRLIDADALEISTEFSDDGEYSWDVVPAFRIRNAPTIDAVPVVRCKDCIYNAIGSCAFGEDYDPNYDEEFYCAHGERREDG